MASRSAVPERLAKARERFLCAEPVDRDVVRDPILASWVRSRQWHVAADRIDLRYIQDPDPETMLARTADPVLNQLLEELDGQPISIILTDANGLVLTRLTADPDLERHLESVMLAPGFSYAEELVGTNGIGTALEAGGPAHVFGHEHYAEHLEGLACAGVPLHHPVSGKTIGVIDLTCWRRDADRHLLSLAKATGAQITHALATATSNRDFQLMQEYLRACRHSGGIVLAVGNDVVMLNDHARRLLDPGDQAVLIGQATEVLATRRSGMVSVELPSGAVARMSCRRVSEAADGVVQVRLRPASAVPVAGPVSGAGSASGGGAAAGTGPVSGAGSRPARAMYLPGLVGSGALWLRACREAEAAYDTGEWLAIEGEPGTGKLAVARAVHQRRNPAAPCHVADARDGRARDGRGRDGGARDGRGRDGGGWLGGVRHELLHGTGILIIQHGEALTGRSVNALASALQEARDADRSRWLRVALTLDRKQAGTDLTRLLRFFPGTVQIPPLRHHVEDLQELVPHFLARLSQHGRVACPPETMQLLQRHNWPGNTGQLWQVLRQVVRRRRAGAITPRDLPPECWTVSRRMLSPLESLERDAIVASLLDHNGNKVRAAEALGMSRATIYRKIHDYGIATP